MKGRIKPIVLTGLALFIIAGCGKKSNGEFRNIEVIQQNEGIPVRVESVSPQQFSISLLYNTNLTGIKETSLTSLLSDRIEKIYVKVGDFVTKDDILISFPEDNPGSQYRQAKAAYENTAQTYERLRNLYEQGGISRQELDQVGTALQVSEANYKSAEKLIKVRAPYDGYITHINSRETQSVGHGDALLTIAHVNKYQAKIWVTENDIFSVESGQKVYAKWQDYILPGKVIQVSRSIDRNRQAFAVDLEFDNPNSFLLSGVMASVELMIYDNPHAIIVPRQYIQTDERGNFVFLAKEGNAVKAYIELGLDDRLQYEVVSGLMANDSLIREGAHHVTAGSKIRIVN